MAHQTDNADANVIKFGRNDGNVVHLDRPIYGGDQDETQAEPECENGVCILAWKPRRPSAAA